MKILITGAAGYIGSHLLKQLLETTTYEITVIDNLSTGNINLLKSLEKIRSFKFLHMDLKEFDLIDTILKESRFDVIFHFAASIIVSESFANPLKYYLNNTVNTTNLINSAIKSNVKKFIFSSSAAVYGNMNVKNSNIDENAPCNPISPYGKSKLMSEQILIDAKKSSKNFKFVIFRYFNVAGADIHDKEGKLFPRIGQLSQKSTHLVKIASECALNKRDFISIYGKDYPTLDGTCIRDYIHVDDLVDAHILAIDYLDKNESDIFNIGYNKGYSVKEIIETMKKISNYNFDIKIEKRREGDPAKLIANNEKIKKLMNWVPKYDDINLICESAYLWEKRNSK